MCGEEILTCQYPQLTVMKNQKPFRGLKRISALRNVLLFLIIFARIIMALSQFSKF
jgi:hypothetical protein